MQPSRNLGCCKYRTFPLVWKLNEDWKVNERSDFFSGLALHYHLGRVMGGPQWLVFPKDFVLVILAVQEQVLEYMASQNVTRIWALLCR